MNLLAIQSSVFGENGVSSQLLQQLQQELTAQQPALSVVTRKLDAESMPHIDLELLGALGKSAQQRSAEEQQKVAFADELIHEVQTADIIALAVPMYNFGVPSTLKAWFDHIARSQTTFRYTENGPQGLLLNKKAVVLMSTGGVSPGSSADLETGYVKLFLGFLGIHDVHFIYAAGVNQSHKREQALQQAHNDVSSWVQQITNEVTYA